MRGLPRLALGALLAAALLLCVAGEDAAAPEQPAVLSETPAESTLPAAEAEPASAEPANAEPAEPLSAAAEPEPGPPAQQEEPAAVASPPEQKVEETRDAAVAADVDAEIDEIEDLIQQLQAKVARLRSVRAGATAGRAKPHAKRSDAAARGGGGAREAARRGADPLEERIHAEEAAAMRGEDDAFEATDGDIEEWLEVTGRLKFDVEITALTFLPTSAPYNAVPPTGGRKQPPVVDPRAPRRFVVADASGWLRCFDHAGTELASLQTNGTARITSITTTPYVDDILLVAGDVEGWVRAYSVRIEKPRRPQKGTGSGPAVPPVTITFEAEWQLPQGANGAAPPAATALVAYRRIRATNIVVGDSSGSIASFSRNGTYLGFVKARGALLALEMTGNLLVYSTDAGEFGVIDVRSWALTPLPCAGMRQSVITSLALDPHSPSALFAGTACGQLLSLRLTGDAKGTKCKVATSVAAAHAGAPSTSASPGAAPLRPPLPAPRRRGDGAGGRRGYVLSASGADGLAVHNTTFLGRRRPGLVFRLPRGPPSGEGAAGAPADPLAERRRPVARPVLMRANNARREGPQAAVVVGHDGSLVVYSVNLPYEIERVPWQVWKSPLAVGALVFVIFWQFKKFKGGSKSPAERFAAAGPGAGRGPRTQREREREAMESLSAMLGGGGGAGLGSGGGRSGAGDRRVRGGGRGQVRGGGGGGAGELDALRAKVDALTSRLSAVGAEAPAAGVGPASSYGGVD
eukprot:tig00000769_g4021.t1